MEKKSAGMLKKNWKSPKGRRMNPATLISSFAVELTLKIMFIYISAWQSSVVHASCNPQNTALYIF